ncbi:hypothetical protein EBU95_07805 [bacterium]|nr:hypothetical protein [bacterium]
MKKILTEALVLQYKKSIQLQEILRGAISNPVFNNFKKYENEIEIQLYESLVGGRPAPAKISPGLGGSGRFGKDTAAIDALETAVRTANMYDFTLLNNLASGVSQVMQAVDPVIALLNSENADVKATSTQLIGKVYVYLKNMFDVVVNAANTLKSKLPSGFSEKTVSDALKAAAEAKRKSDAEADAFQKEKFKESAKNIKRIFGQKNLNEGLMSDLLNPGNGKLDKYTSKVDAFIDDAIETCDELVEEGNGLLEEDFYRLPQAGERSRLILEMIGLIKKFKYNLENIPWQLRQRMG